MVAWAVGTALAVLVAWFGAQAVIHGTNGPVVPVLNGATAPRAGAGGAGPPAGGSRSPGSPPAVTPSGASPSAPGRSHPVPSPATSPRPSPDPTGTHQPAPGEHIYLLTGGTVTVQITASTATLIAAVPLLGYTVQHWSSPGWFRVDFSQSGKEVSSLIANWYQQAPAIVIGG